MITHKDYFSGFCGKTNKLGNPRMYTTPTTAQIFPDYSFSVTGNIKGTLEACSLDGRLWLFRRSKRLAVVGCSFGDDKLSIASSQNLSNNDDVILARGLNWILSNKHIFMVDDNGTVSYASLFDDNIPDLFLYSPLRSVSGGGGNYSLGSTQMLDPFTNQPWGKREDNGNSDGNAFFSKDTHLLYPPNSHSFEQCYSLLPEVGEWVLFENFLIRKPDKALSDSYNYMLNIRPFIPLELHHAGKCVPAFGTGYNLDNRGVQVAVLNGQLWARGLYHIGKVYIIAAGFDKDSEPREFYLYISPDFPNLNTDPKNKNDWLSVAIAPIGSKNICAYYSNENDPIHGGTCMRSTNSDILNTSGDVCSWETLSEDNGQLFFDYSSAVALMLDDNGAKVFSESIDKPTTYQCSTLRQWIDPAGSIEAVPDWGVLSKDDLALFFSEFQRGFHRSRLIAGQTLPLSATSYALNDDSNVRLSVDVSSSSSEAPNFQVKHSVSEAGNFNPLAWDNVFRQPVTLHYIGKITPPYFDSKPCCFALHENDFSRAGKHLINDEWSSEDTIHENNSEFYTLGGNNSLTFFPIFCTRLELVDQVPDGPVSGKYYYVPHLEEEKYYYNSIEADFLCLNLETLSHRTISVRFHTSEDIPDWPKGLVQCFLSHDSIGFIYAYIDDPYSMTQEELDSLGIEVSAWIPTSYAYYQIYRPLTLQEWHDECWAWQDIDYTGRIISSVECESLPYYLKKICADYDCLKHGISFDYLTNSKRYSLVAPSLRLSIVFSDKRNPEVSYAVFYSAFSNIPFTIEIQEKGVNTIECYSYPDSSVYFTLEDGTKVAISNLHMAIVQNNDGSLTLYSFKSEFDNNKFDFIADYERSKPA